MCESNRRIVNEVKLFLVSVKAMEYGWLLYGVHCSKSVYCLDTFFFFFFLICSGFSLFY